ncbi:MULTISPECIES: GntR family transcriptional regulator [Clostridium]|uniref:GntR family transcriptional regulator n=1 Tax=Clostridium cibarium TaxID=2762247 RepID=A0ABR8PRA6_9CLOT|nr:MULTISPECIES: GntR family transcriptional regulator [Clostridium]MBD7910710.1 GntR family transcriptional regulator [Clostridium cibarium]
MLKYEEIALDIQHKINSGEYLPNDQLPLEKEMCVQYGVSRITIKKAMDKLVMSGSVVKRRGSGTFVKDVDYNEVSDVSASSQFTGFSGNFKNKEIVSKIIEFQVINPTEEIANKLKMETDEFVYYICRVRYADNDPYVIEYTYMPIDIIPGLKKDVLRNSIYKYIEETLKLKIKSAHRTVRALLPNELEQENLEIAENFPILEVEQIAFLDNGQPYEYSKSHHRSDRFEFKSISVR